MVIERPAPVYAWRRGMFAPGVVHLAEVGQVERVTHRYGRRWVWSVHGVAVQADNGEDGRTQRCGRCVAWLSDDTRVGVGDG